MVVLGQQPATITDMIMCQCLASHDEVLSGKETYICTLFEFISNLDFARSEEKGKRMGDKSIILCICEWQNVKIGVIFCSCLYCGLFGWF